MNTDQQKEDRLLYSIISPPPPISDFSIVLRDIVENILMVYPGLSRLPKISSACTEYFEAHSNYERERALEKLITCRARHPKPTDDAKGEEEDWFEERPDEKQALQQLIPVLKAFLLEANKDAQPYLSEESLDELWTRIESCEMAMGDGDAGKCFKLVGQIQEDLVRGIGDMSEVYRELADVMGRLCTMLENVR
ncbi:hypothetical protein EG329_005249 [Mollisiaceae sp. DMI_Dod_QoI]|nr:hypothetical protein EG329_005249 [Helotiales sp. DMI_Dod_QoI]